ncbi:hypothetical protein dsat_2096 [Alkalidesulfovibrio alkalitolerans DSM 16529]|uniref:Uncharacterized protein n=1 Tax=Alkalidesulfovibrio alkalitolerans DSM 16529 TaxID=1121439 RepID=S7TFN1_9BACT|nr:hypothetical protein [Alkalidesulfovibrio alkalitolerans]EPR35395.1 hypothetical protein dsat_2096 [Alkalidesulfovibrio alkalitolerans DSM 16529]
MSRKEAIHVFTPALAVALLLAAVLALGPLTPRAQAADWLPADDAVGFWGVKLPAPDNAVNWDMGSIYPMKNADYAVTYGYMVDGKFFWAIYNLSKGRVIRQWEADTKEKWYAAMREAQGMAGERLHLKSLGKLNTPRIRDLGDVGGGTNSSPFEYGISYVLDGEPHEEALAWVTEQPRRFACYGHHEWTFELPCEGYIHVSSLGIFFIFLLSDGTLLAYDSENPFIIRFREDMSSPFIDQHPELVRVPFRDAYDYYMKVAAEIREQRPENILEEIDAVVAPHFRTLLHNKENAR